MKYSLHRNILFLAIILLGFSCSDLVMDGIEVDYPTSNAQLAVDAIAGTSGAADEMISFQISVTSDSDIKSCIVQSNNDGQNGSGFNVSSQDFDDPFADHIFGTVRKGVRSFKVRYDYIIPAEVRRSRLTFSVISETGRVSVEKVVDVIPSIEKYTDLNIYAKDKIFYDAFASIDGTVYGDLKSNYSTLSTENVEAQAKIDIVFYYDQASGQSVLASPASNRVDLELNIENQTLFRRLDNVENLDVSQLTPADLLALTADAALATEGSSHLTGIRVGQVIGFLTDLNARHSLKVGILKVTGLHPTSIPRYEGLSYVLECDVVVQN